MGLLKMGEDFMVDLNEVWISTVPEFRELLMRDRGNKKDGPGRYKRKAHRDFLFIWLMYDFDSDLLELNEDEKELEACRRTDREPWQVQEDQILQDAIKAYIRIQDNKSSAYRTWHKLKSANDKGLQFIESIDLDATLESGAAKHKYKEISDAIKAQPGVEKALDEIKSLAKKQLSGDAGVRGDAIKGFDEDPD